MQGWGARGAWGGMGGWGGEDVQGGGRWKQARVSVAGGGKEEISAVCARIACDLCPVAYGSIQVHTYAYSSFVAYTCLDSNFLMHTAAM